MAASTSGFGLGQHSHQLSKRRYSDCFHLLSPETALASMVASAEHAIVWDLVLALPSRSTELSTRAYVQFPALKSNIYGLAMSIKPPPFNCHKQAL